MRKSSKNNKAAVTSKATKAAKIQPSKTTGVITSLNESLPIQTKSHFLFSSESVSIGHPDKLCDYISDCILDACLEIDPDAKVACETGVKNSLVMVLGELSSKKISELQESTTTITTLPSKNKKFNIERIVRNAIKDVGYDSINKGMDYKTAGVLIEIDQQSQEIANAVHVQKSIEEIGAGDQGIIIGYASDETEELMPMTQSLCNRLIARLHEVRMNSICPWMGADAKVQVTVEYEKIPPNTIKPIRIHTILISQQHSNEIGGISKEKICQELMQHVIRAVVPAELLDSNTIYHLNPAGPFIVGGPMSDAGMTGRKIIVDTYGGWGGHGGGAFSGKDPSKVDRSACYAARWVAKSLVYNRMCARVLVQISYGIGIANPLSIHVDSFGTAAQKGFTDHDLREIVLQNFDLRPGIIIRDLNLKRPIYKKTAFGGHFGRNDPDFTWETPKDLSHVFTKINISQQQEQLSFMNKDAAEYNLIPS